MSYDAVKEDVPLYIRRVGDRIIEGSNNAQIMLGTDRAAPEKAALNSGLGHVDAPGGGVGTGTIHMVVGRDSEDTNFDTDKSFIYLSMKTNVDENLQLEDIVESNNDVPSAVIKSDCVRVVARSDVKISVGGAFIYMKSDGTIIIDGPKVQLGEGATERIIKGDAFMGYFNKHVHNTPAGPSDKPLKQMEETLLSSRKVTVK